jgi:hypothetical protein
VKPLSTIDELDELGLPSPLPQIRRCSRRECRRTARPGGRYCRQCATDATRRWRERQRPVLLERERSRTFSEQDQLVRRARAYVAEYVKRGKLARGRCEVCRDAEVIATWDDPKQPRAVRWLCGEHYVDRRESRRDAEAARARLSDSWAEVRAELALLPATVQAELHQVALAGPVGDGCRAGSTFYWWTLRQALWRRRSSGIMPT